jgi:hypothetical protein
MAWVALSVSDIQNSLTEEEQAGLQTGSAQADLTVIVQSVTGLVRGKVNSNKRNQGHLGPPGTIPDELYAAAIAIARFKFLTHLPGTQLITQDRRQENTDGHTELNDASTGALVVVRGDDVSGQTPVLGSASDTSLPLGNLQGGPPYIMEPWGNWELMW